jgi:glycosyltransferase involved in cell wall biosynthesis
MYKVTLAIPVYNVEKYIERALNSALNQTFESIEYLLIDDGGTDNSLNVAKAIIENHPRGEDVKIINHGVNIGTGAVKNTAIDNTHSEFIYFMDSDDEITSDCISTLYNAMVETPVDFIAASHKCKTLTGQSSDLHSETIYSNTLIKSSEHAVEKSFYLERTPITVYTWNKLYNVNFLKNNNIKCIPHHLSEDIWFTYQIILKAQSCRLLSYVTYFYYETPNSTAWKYNSRKYLPLKAAKTFEEIVTLQTNYAQNYKGQEFYSNLILESYNFAVRYAILIYTSKVIHLKEKTIITRNMLLTYPMTLRELMKTQHKNGFKSKVYHYANYFISKMPTVSLKIFLHRIFIIFKNYRMKFMQLYLWRNLYK